MTAASGITTSGQPPTAVVNVQPGMNVQPVVLVDQNGQYVTPGGSSTTAGSLATTTVPVNVAAATAPSSGNVLTATSGTTATWQALPTGTTAATGVLQLDGTAGDIQPLGAAAAAGATGKTADAGHVHTAANGITPVSSGWTVWSTGQGVDLLNNTSFSSVTMVSGTIYYTATYIGSNCTLTGILMGIGTTAGTDKWIVILYNSAGTVVANSATAGTNVSASTSSKQQIAFTAPVAVTGPGLYYIGVQSNGTTAKFQGYGNALEAFAAATKTGNSFGTLTLGAPTTTYTTATGPAACTY